MELNQKAVIAVTNFFEEQKDDFFITSVGTEERCLGIPSILDGKIKFQNIVVFIFNADNQHTKMNEVEFKKLLKDKSDNIIEIFVSDVNPIESITEFYDKLKSFQKSVVTIDISTIPVKHLLMLLKTLDDLDLWANIRIYYTEPKNYRTELYLPMSIGINSPDTVWEFIGNQSASLPPLLIEFLGYEGDRAKAIYKNFEAEETVLIIPRPAFYEDWNGKTEKFNNMLLKLVGSENTEYASPVDLNNVISVLENINKKFPMGKYRWTVVPLGTKPQALGTYLFWRSNPNAFSIIYADPLKDNIIYAAEGIGTSRILLSSKLS